MSLVLFGLQHGQLPQKGGLNGWLGFPLLQRRSLPPFGDIRFTFPVPAEGSCRLFGRAKERGRRAEGSGPSGRPGVEPTSPGDWFGRAGWSVAVAFGASSCWVKLKASICLRICRIVSVGDEGNLVFSVDLSKWKTGWIHILC